MCFRGIRPPPLTFVTIRPGQSVAAVGSSVLLAFLVYAVLIFHQDPHQRRLLDHIPLPQNSPLAGFFVQQSARDTSSRRHLLVRQELLDIVLVLLCRRPKHVGDVNVSHRFVVVGHCSPNKRPPVRVVPCLLQYDVEGNQEGYLDLGLPCAERIQDGAKVEPEEGDVARLPQLDLQRLQVGKVENAPPEAPLRRVPFLRLELQVRLGRRLVKGLVCLDDEVADLPVEIQRLRAAGRLLDIQDEGVVLVVGFERFGGNYRMGLCRRGYRVRLGVVEGDGVWDVNEMWVYHVPKFTGETEKLECILPDLRRHLVQSRGVDSREWKQWWQ
ncbi:hypothetical protein BS50DRAFT_140931 [Corynespora cassiicola Philippines]|uniref:Uncharacterized protein n=1 Tax=Corynespora cassiicola Philippines TaxID=1448308 RepID=A0A2T2N9Y0_CORCC|nr:hypothetical protein BS50DRAFT_140931 [Corynespora cassiicola Philippines]